MRAEKDNADVVKMLMALDNAAAGAGLGSEGNSGADSSPATSSFLSSEGSSGADSSPATSSFLSSVGCRVGDAGGEDDSCAGEDSVIVSLQRNFPTVRISQ